VDLSGRWTYTHEENGEYCSAIHMGLTALVFLAGAVSVLGILWQQA
jgi:hypothetical protein